MTSPFGVTAKAEGSAWYCFSGNALASVAFWANGYPQWGQVVVPGRTSLPQSGHLVSVSIRKPQCGQTWALSLTFVLHSGQDIRMENLPQTHALSNGVFIFSRLISGT